MQLIKICAYEVTTFDPVFTKTLTCCDPKFTPVGAGSQCNICCYNAKVDLGTTPPTLCFSYDAQFEYAYHDKHHSEHDKVGYKCGSSCTFLDFCDIIGNSACVTLPDGVTVCPCGGGDPEVTCYATCDPCSITTTPTSVTGSITISLRVTNLCVPTTVCVETVPCEDCAVRYYT